MVVQVKNKPTEKDATLNALAIVIIGHLLKKRD